MYRLEEYLRETGQESGLGDMDPEQFGVPDNEIDNIVDVSEWQDLKTRSLEMHRTQMDPNSPFNRLPPDLAKVLRAKEYFVLAKGDPTPEGEQYKGDLFAGLR